MTDIPLRDYVDVRWTDHRIEHEQQFVAIDNARDEVNRRLAEMNDLRRQITDERADFLTRAEYDAKHEALIERISSMERSRANLEGRMWAIGAVLVLIQVIVRFLPSLGG